MKIDKPKKAGDQASELIELTLLGYLSNRATAEGIVDSISSNLPIDVVSRLDEVMSLQSPSYRDGLIIQLAFGINGALDFTKRPEGGRSVAQRLGALFKREHIRGVTDAYQNIGKNSQDLCRGNVLAFDDSLRWANTASPTQHRSALAYVIASVSLTARPVQAMPALDRATLTFFNVAKFLSELLAIPSAGAHQQFAVVAFLDAVIDEFGMGGPKGLRVETKKLFASDTSSKTAGDIQILRANRVEEAFEVTANDWISKLAPASKVMKDADLQRVHIIAAVGPAFVQEMDKWGSANLDLSVIDVEALLRTTAAVMRKPAREMALRRLYDLLDRYQPDSNRVNAYVDLLRSHKLTA